MFFVESTLLQEDMPLQLLAQNCGLHYQTVLSLLTLLASNGNLRHISCTKKIHKYVFQQHLTYQELNAKSLGNFINEILSVFFM